MKSPDLVLATAMMLAVLICLILAMVIRGARKTSSLKDYAVGSRGFSPVVVGLSLAASVTSAATFIINPGFIALYGMSGVLALGVVLPIALYVSLTILTRSFRKYGQTTEALTMAQWIGNRFHSKAFAFFFAVLSLLLITFIVLICVGITKVLSQALEVNEMWVLGGLIFFVFGYMMFGGANSMVYTNTIQAGLMILVAVILLGSGYSFFEEGMSGFFGKLSAIDPNLTTTTNPESPLFRDFLEIVLCNALVGIAVVCQPHIITKSLLLKEDRQVRPYLLTAILTMSLFFLVVVAGLYARITFPDMLSSTGEAIPMDGLMSAYVVEAFPVAVSVLVILGLISAGLSTLEGLVQSIPTSITTDIISRLLTQLGQEPSQGKLTSINRMVIILLAIVTFLLSADQLQNPSLSVGIFAQNGVYAYFSAAFVPVLMGIFLTNVPLIAPVSAAATAIIVHFSVYYGRLGPYMQMEIRNPAVASASAIILSVVIGFGLYFLLRQRSTSLSSVAS